MIIEKIKLENFASYGREELDLRTLGRAVSIQGNTGAGKTTFFIDAATFALFGRAYGELDKQAAGWVVPPSSIGSTRVEVDFRIGGRGYRALRSISRGRREARLANIDGEGHEAGSVAVDVRSVDKKVSDLTGLDFQTFLSTVVVRQGDVAKIVSHDLTPADRREIFLRSFHIDFKRHKEIAERRFKEADEEIRGYETEESKLKEKAGERDTLKGQASQTLEDLQGKRRKEDSLRRAIEGLEGQLEELRKKENEIAGLVGGLKQKEVELKTQKAKLQGYIKESEDLIVKVKGALPLKGEEEGILKQNRALNDALPYVTNLSSLQTQHDSKMAEAERLKSNPEAAEKQRKHLEELEKKAAEVPQIQRELDDAEEEYKRIFQELERGRGRMDLLEANLRTLQETPGVEVRCPVCSTNLTPDRVKETTDHLSSELEDIRRKIDALTPLTPEAKRKVENKQRLLQRAKSATDQIEAARERLKEFEEGAKHYRDMLGGAEGLLKKMNEEKDRLVALLGKAMSPSDFQIAMKSIESKLRGVRSKLEEAGKAEGRLQTIEGEIAALTSALETLASELAGADKIYRQQGEIQGRIGKVDGERKKLDEELGQLTKGIGELEERERIMKQQLGEAEKAGEELKSLKEKMEKRKNCRDAYELLYREVFHDRGLPLALLRDFLQSVEEWSRGYIHRFLPGKDIRVSADEQGQVSIKVLDGTAERDLVTYSGGETMLIGFALRLGIAKTIVEMRLANAPKFLIVDEGFGPLSSDFRQEVLKTLQELSTEYEQILTISHIEDVKESPYFSSYLKVYRDQQNQSHIKLQS